MLLTHPCLVFLDLSKGYSSVVELKALSSVSMRETGRDTTMFSRPLTTVTQKDPACSASRTLIIKKTHFLQKNLYSVTGKCEKSGTPDLTCLSRIGKGILVGHRNKVLRDTGKQLKVKTMKL